MMARLAALILLATPLSAQAAEDLPPVQGLDLSGVTLVRITGEAGAIALTTVESETLSAKLSARRSGWFANWTSSWFYDDCRMASHMAIEGSMLVIDMQSTSWLDPSECRVELTANLRKGIAVAIDQVASQVRLDGEFAALSLQAKALDLTFEGHAGSLDLHGEAMRSHLTFDRTDGNETIAINARSLDTSLAFAPGTKISYAVKATAALVNSALPDTPGAEPRVMITGDYVRATIR